MTVRETWQGLFNRELPGKVVCVGLNYRVHAEESSLTVPGLPLLFGKFANTIIDNGEPILLTAGIGHTDAEAELAIVIGKSTRHVSPKDALKFVYGYTAANDVSARDIQFADQQWFRGKGFDTFCPLLSTVVPVSELGAANNLRVVQRLNGTTLQDGSTSDLIYDVPALVSFVSSVITLEPGDIVLTGTPDGVGFFREPKITMKPGDVVEIEIEGIGCLRNTVDFDDR